jgi:hypothetical protein
MRDGTSALATLKSSQQAFELRWRYTRSVWDDAVQRTFEHEHLEPILSQVEAAQSELERLLRVIAQARRNVR